MNVLRHDSYELFWNEANGWSYSGIGKELSINKLENMRTAPFELGGIISSIRHNYIGDSVIEKESSIDELMKHAATTHNSDDPQIITMRALLDQRMLWWMNKYGCLNTYDTKPEYRTMTVFISQAKKFEWIFDYMTEIGLYAAALPDGLLRMRPTVDINPQTKRSYRKNEVNAVSKEDFAQYVQEMIIAGMTKFVHGTIDEPIPTNMQGALWLIADQELQNKTSLIRCANISTPCMSLIELKNEPNPQRACSSNCQAIINLLQ
jgi:hypothetical protein|tara:strand:+ start:426 stop:1214 length:789 start_codon:yes stop_codon:yes gene_type:complete